MNKLTAKDYRTAPKPIHQAAKEVERLTEVHAECWTARDRAAHPDVTNRARQKDAEAVAAAYGPGGDGHRVDPRKHEKEAEELQATTQARLSGVSLALSQALQAFREARDAHPEWRDQALQEVALAEGDLEALVSGAKEVHAALELRGRLLSVARGGSTGVAPHHLERGEPRPWSGLQARAQAIQALEAAAAYVGRDGVPALDAPWTAEAEAEEVVA